MHKFFKNYIVLIEGMDVVKYGLYKRNVDYLMYFVIYKKLHLLLCGFTMLTHYVNTLLFFKSKDPFRNKYLVSPLLRASVLSALAGLISFILTQIDYTLWAIFFTYLMLNIVMHTIAYKPDSTTFNFSELSLDTLCRSINAKLTLLRNTRVQCDDKFFKRELEDLKNKLIVLTSNTMLKIAEKFNNTELKDFSTIARKIVENLETKNFDVETAWKIILELLCI